MTNKSGASYLDIDALTLPELTLLSLADMISQWHKDETRDIVDLIDMSLFVEARLRDIAVLIKLPSLN